MEKLKFVRVNARSVVNLAYVVKLEISSKGALSLTLANGDVLHVEAPYQTVVKGAIGVPIST
jgi:hypothetical protein